MRRRSVSEISFRLRQEARNFAMLARPPKLPGDASPHAPFPDPEFAIRSLHSHPSREVLIATADRLMRHRFPILGMEVETGPEIRWRRDYVNGKETPPDYFRKVPYLDLAIAGDHKIIWELNRHQHLVLLAQAYRLTGCRQYLDEIAAQLDTWFAANPMQRGINWASALEVAFRSLSWMWVDHLAGAEMNPSARKRLWEGLYQHAAHLEANLSVYFSPNTHLLGEAVALHALGRMFEHVPAGRRWELLGARIVQEEMLRQVRPDGSHFEQSSYYHVYALDMFLFHALLIQPSPAYLESLKRMAVYLEALMGPSRSLPFMGDDDGGRLFHPYGAREHFGAATLAACGCYLQRAEWIESPEELHDLAAWWMGERASLTFPAQPRADKTSALFPDAGIVALRSGAVHCIVDVGPFGPFRGGHSHADALSIVARSGDRELLIDPGTFAYSGEWRDRFRGTAAHNTVRIAGLDQAEPAGSFAWRNPPRVELRQWHSEAAFDFVDASCEYRGYRHRRRVYFRKPEMMLILDEVFGEEIEAEQFWHSGGPVTMASPGCFRIADAGTLILAGDGANQTEEGQYGWRSPAYGAKMPAPVIACRRQGGKAVVFGAVLVFSDSPLAAAATIAAEQGSVDLAVTGAWRLNLRFPDSGVPRYGFD